MRWVPCLVLVGCGLTLDLTPPREDGGIGDASRDATFDVGRDARADVDRADVPARECDTPDDCFLPDCTRRTCEGGFCVDGGAIACAPTDECHFNTGTCRPDGSCDEALIDEDGDGHAAFYLGLCGDDCDDDDAGMWLGLACAEDLDGDGFGSDEEFGYICGEVMCADGLVPNRRDCWDEDREDIDPGEPDPIAANPNANDVFFPFPRGNGTFDWNCDGEITTNNGVDVFVACGGTDEPPGSCRAQGGWADRASVPECGETGEWVGCVPGPMGCERALFMERVQRCR